MKVEQDLTNDATKTDLKNAAGVDTSSFAKKTDLTSLKYNADKKDIDKFRNVPTKLKNLKSKIDKLDVDKLVPVPVDLSKLSDVVKNDVVKKDGYNAYGLKLIRSITKNSDDYDVKHMNIKFDSDDDLHLNKTIEIPIVTIVIRAVFHENNKYYTQVFLDECLYKI